MAQLQGAQVPKGLDDPPRFLFWDLMTVSLFLGGIVLGSVINHLGVGFLLGSITSVAWQRATNLRRKGALQHLVYWYIGWRGLKGTPNSHQRHWLG